MRFEPTGSLEVDEVLSAETSATRVLVFPLSQQRRRDETLEYARDLAQQLMMILRDADAPGPSLLIAAAVRELDAVMLGQ